MSIKVDEYEKHIFTFVSIFMILALCYPIFTTRFHVTYGSESSSIVVWANDGGDKVTRDELSSYNDPASLIKSVWDG